MPKKKMGLVVMGMGTVFALVGCVLTLRARPAVQEINPQDVDPICGDWQATVDIADQVNKECFSDSKFGSALYLENAPIKVNFYIDLDGTYALFVSKDSVLAVNELLLSSIQQGVPAYYMDLLEVEADELDGALSSLRIDLNREIATASTGISYHGFLHNGRYVNDDGKLYLLNEGETSPTDNTSFFACNLSEDTLELTWAMAKTDFGLKTFPVVFQRLSEGPIC